MVSNNNSIGADENRFRHAYHISGDIAWVRQSLNQYLPAAYSSQAVWVSKSAPAGVTGIAPENYLSLLGRDIKVLVYDAFDGFDAECFGAICGAVGGHGFFILLTPSESNWGKVQNALSPYNEGDNKNVKSSLFIDYFLKHVNQTKAFIRISRQSNNQNPKPVYGRMEINQYGEQHIKYSPDQDKAINALVRVANGHRKRPLVLTADRGRGKTTAIGISAAKLLIERPRQIVITAPKQQAVETAFKHAEQELDASGIKYRRKKTSLHIAGGSFVFYSPDMMRLENIHADLLFVDEAAAIPVPFLTHFLTRHSRIAFSTTVHGYEGTGRGFEIRFLSRLNKLAPQWTSLHMKEPVRWSRGDPLEAFLFETLLLNASPCGSAIAEAAQAESLIFKELSREDLVTNATLLKELFGLMVLAHYRTSPSDLQMMLDTPGFRIFAMQYSDHIIAATWLIPEGRFNEEEAKLIQSGKRRFKGHLIAQSIATHLGLPQAAVQRSARVIRIAVHPQAQGKGIGRNLLTTVRQKLQPEYDFLATSFGGIGSLFDFWTACGFQPLRLGIKREASSGERALMMAQGLSVEGKQLVAFATTVFREDFPLQLMDFYTDLEIDLIIRLLLASSGGKSYELSEREKMTISDFISNYRTYDGASATLWRYLTSDSNALKKLNQLEATFKNVIVAKIVLKKEWVLIVKEYGLKGKKEAESILRAGIAKLWIKTA